MAKDRKSARAAAAAAAATLAAGTGATEGSGTEGSGTSEGSASTNESSGTTASAPTTAPSPTQASNGNGNGKGKKEKTDIFSQARLETCVGLRKALWSTQGQILTPMNSGAMEFKVEIVKKSVINKLEALMEQFGENHAAPWVFVHCVPGDPSKGCILMAPESLPSKAQVTVAKEATEVPGTISGEDKTESGEEQKTDETATAT